MQLHEHQARRQAPEALADLFDQTPQFKLVTKKTGEFARETQFENLSVLASHPSLVELAVKLFE